MSVLRRVGAAVPLCILVQVAGLAACVQSGFGQNTVEAGVAVRAGVEAGGGAAALFSGEDFAGLEFPVVPAAGRVEIEGQRVYSWKSGDAQRLFVSGDAKVTLGGYRFEGRHCALWIKRLSENGDGGTYQIFLAIDDAGGASLTAASAITTDRLGVRAVIASAGPPRVRADAVFSEPATDESELLSESGRLFVGASRAMLARSLSRLQDPTWGVEQVPPVPYVRELRLKNPPMVPEKTQPLAVAVVPRAGAGGVATGGTSVGNAAPGSGSRAGSRSVGGPVGGPVGAVVSGGEATRAVAAGGTAGGVKSASTAGGVATDGNAGAAGTGAAAGTASGGSASTGTPAGEGAGKASQGGTVAPGAGSAVANAEAARAGNVGNAGRSNAEPSSEAAKAGGGAIFAKSGVITLLARDVTVVSGETENAVVGTNGVVVQYSDATSGRLMQLQAQRAVVFLAPGRLEDAARLSVESIRGLFLEGDVTVSDGKFTLRGPQVYYDLANNRALMLDAVFWTYDEQRQLPLYVRAKSIQQTAADQFVAKRAMLTNTALLDPELSIGASSVTITRRDQNVRAEPLAAGGATGTAGVVGGVAGEVGDGSGATQSTTLIAAENITLRAGGLPIFWWPSYTGDPSLNPIKDMRVENKGGSSAAVKLTLNAYSLLGLKKHGEVKADLLLDYYFERGAAVGTRLSWDRPDSKGSLFGYMVPIDGGSDLLKSGTEIVRDDDFRGLIVGEQRWQLDDKWSLFVEGAYISDETFIDAFFEDQGETRREFTNRLRADRLDGNTALTMEAKGSANDFIANEWLLQSQGYSVTKLPEVTYVRQADDLIADRPGLVSYWSEYRVGALALAFDEIRPDQRGYASTTAAQRAFGLLPGQTYADRLRSIGYFEDMVYRGDTRHELSLNALAGPVRIQPFVVGRLTAYDNDFSQFSPQEDDQARLYGAAGVRTSTTLQRIYDGVDSEILDIHRLRHIVEPSFTAWHAGTNVTGTDLPVYDESVEAIADGSIVRIGATQTLETQRGAPGRWHSTNLLTLSTDYVISSGNADRKSPIGRFFDYRPEYANPGEYFVGDLVYRLTDATAITGGTVYDFDRNQQAMGNAGVILQHAANFSTFGEFRYINELDSTYLNFGGAYELTSKYSLTFSAAYDMDEKAFQSSDFEIRRKFASMIFGVNLGVNEITGETSFGFVIRPYGVGGEARVGGAGTSDFGS